MTLRSHLVELRNRLFLVAAVLISVSTLAYIFRDNVVGTILSPLDGRQLQYLTPGGGFTFIFAVVFFTGLAAAIPLLIQQLYAFLSPALSRKVGRRGGWLLFWSSILLVIGVLFGHLYAVPGALNFLYGFADEYVVSALTAESYLNFVIKYTLGLGLIFQIPLIMMIIHWIKPQKPLKLLKFERWVILLAFILGAIITPTPDPVNQAIVALPIIAVYQIGLIAIVLSIRRDKRAARKRQQQRLVDRQNSRPSPLRTPKPQPVRTVTSPALHMHTSAAQPSLAQVTSATSRVITKTSARSIDGIVSRRPQPSRQRIPQQRQPASRPLSLTVPRQATAGPVNLDGIIRRVAPSR